jgi:phosphotransferase system enzyme I (PtsI)
MIHRVVQAAKTAKIQVALCGEMAGDLINVPVLLGLELDAISMNPISIPGVKNLVRALSFEESKQLVHAALKQATTSGVLELIQEAYGKSFETAPFFQASGE